MAIAFRSAQGSNNAGGGTTLTMAVPAGVVDGDVLAMAIAVRGGTGTTISVAPWTHRTSGFSFDFYDVAHNGTNLWVAVGYQGRIQTSPDGVTWTNRTSSIGANDVMGVAFGNGLWVAVSNSAGIYTSTDGITWTHRTSGADGGSTNGIVVYDGTTWFVVSNVLSTSTDGITWTDQGAFGGGSYCMAYDGAGHYVSGGGSGAIIRTSSDGLSWTNRTSPFTTTGFDYVTGLAYGGGTWVAVVNPDSPGETKLIAYSTDNGVNWTVATQPFGNGSYYFDVKFGSGKFVAVGGNNAATVSQVATSTDGITWASSPITTLNATTAWLSAVAYDASGTWALVSRTNLSGSSPADIATASNPAAWTLLGTAINSTTNLTQALYWKIAGGEPASYTFTITSNKASGEIIALSGADSALPVAAQYGGQANASSATVTAPGLGSWTSANGIDLYFGGTATGTTVTSPPASYTKPTNGETASTGGSVGTRTTSEVAYRALSAVTTVASISSVFAAAAVNIGQHLFVKEVPPAPRSLVVPHRHRGLIVR